jgi:hypothetical protein
LVRFAHEWRSGIAIGIDRDGADAYLVGRTDNPSRNLAAIGNE